MGELLLCNRPIAAMPYYIEALSLNIYSLEELCYLMEKNLFLLEEEILSEELFFWIEQEVLEPELAQNLRECSKKEYGIAKAAELIFRETGYLSKEAENRVLEQIREIQHRPALERRKMRADRYVETKKYSSAILEYRRILYLEEECSKNPVFCGNIWHNQGTAFARLFLFKEAKECFKMAYQYHMNMESIYAAMASCWYLGEIEELNSLSEIHGIGESELSSLIQKWEDARQSGLAADFKEQLDVLFQNTSDSLEKNQELMQILKQWELEYQKNSR